MSFNDDEPIVAPADSGPRPTPIVSGRVQLVIRKNKKAPLQENNQKVMLELTGGDSTGDRPGLDLVAVLDVSGSMHGVKIDKMKTAMQFVIKKLSPIDRLSIVTFSSNGARLCPLRQITEASQPELQGLIDGLSADGGTNTSDGLITGLKVLTNRKLSVGRVGGVMLMSDGHENSNSDAAQVDIGNVPVYTFGFGEGYDPTVLYAVANKSMGGTFSVVNDINGLNMAFTQCLAGLLTVVVQDLKLKVERVEEESMIQKVTAGSYPQTQDVDTGSVTVSFGDLYSKEVRKVIVNLLLPATKSKCSPNILAITYSYNTCGKLFDPTPMFQGVDRTSTAAPKDYQSAPEVQTEEARLETVTMIKAARTMANNKNLGGARDKLMEAQKKLEVVVEQSSPLVDMLRTELQQLLELMNSQDVYDKKGRSYAFSLETSHDRQRFAARGDIKSIRLFATPRMDKYLEQAKRFDEDPTAPLPVVDEDPTALLPAVDEDPMAPLSLVDEDPTAPLPSVDEDVKEEVAANPLAPLFYLSLLLLSSISCYILISLVHKLSFRCDFLLVFCFPSPLFLFCFVLFLGLLSITSFHTSPPLQLICFLLALLLPPLCFICELRPIQPSGVHGLGPFTTSERSWS